MIRRLAAALAVIVSLAAPALADTVVMKDGRKVIGRVTETPSEIVVKQKLGEVRLARADVVRIDHDDVFCELDRKQRELGDGTAEQRCQLGAWCRDNGFPDEARAAFTQALAIDPDHAGARAALGYVRENGRWLLLADAMRARGLVQLGEKWVTPAERSLALALAEQKRAEENARTKREQDEREAKRKAQLEAERAARDARIRAYDEELARARARERAEAEAEPAGFTYYSGYVGPYGYLCGPYYGYGYGYGFAPVPTTNDILAYKAVASGRYPYPTAARPFLGATVRIVGAGYGACGPCYGPVYRGSSWGASSFYGFGASFRGSYTSGNGRFQFRFKF